MLSTLDLADANLVSHTKGAPRPRKGIIPPLLLVPSKSTLFLPGEADRGLKKKE
jgi:hypothetical protein